MGRFNMGRFGTGRDGQWQNWYERIGTLPLIFATDRGFTWLVIKGKSQTSSLVNLDNV